MKDLTKLRAPDITLAQITAAVAWIVGQAVSMGALDANSSKVILSVATTIITAAWVIADSVIRHGRATGPVAAAIASDKPTEQALEEAGFTAPKNGTPTPPTPVAPTPSSTPTKIA
jgi:hypothetical protein